MKVSTHVLNAAGDPHFKSEDQFDIKSLMDIAQTREQSARSKGADWTAGAVSFFGGQVVKAVNTGEHKDVTEAIIQMLMAAWVFDSLYCGVTAAQYLESDVQFTITADGAVAHTRVDSRQS